MFCCIMGIVVVKASNTHQIYQVAVRTSTSIVAPGTSNGCRLSVFYQQASFSHPPPSTASCTRLAETLKHQPLASSSCQWLPYVSLTLSIKRPNIIDSFNDMMIPFTNPSTTRLCGSSTLAPPPKPLIVATLIPSPSIKTNRTPPFATRVPSTAPYQPPTKAHAPKQPSQATTPPPTSTPRRSSTASRPPHPSPATPVGLLAPLHHALLETAQQAQQGHQ